MSDQLINLRILSLLPSSTEIVGALGLANYLVGITHECDLCPDVDGLCQILASGVERVTLSRIDPTVLTQGEIDRTVRHSISNGASLYTLNEDAIRRLRPTVVLTQALCSVCAPDADEVAAVCNRLGAEINDADGNAPKVVSLSPSGLDSVRESILTIAEVCGVPNEGKRLSQEFQKRLKHLTQITKSSPSIPPTVLFLEWLDPPFDGGHWVPEQIQAAGGLCISNSAQLKSVQLTWDQIKQMDPDVILVGCCGMALKRNRTDALSWFRDRLDPTLTRALRAIRTQRIYALDGNRFFARPSPSLLEGAVLMAHCIHDGNSPLLNVLNSEGFTASQEDAWARVSLESDSKLKCKSEPTENSSVKEMSVWQLHDLAVAQGALSYLDPNNGFHVFTSSGLLAKGRCCGGGCRHCPFAHENVGNKAANIKQPAFLYVRQHHEIEHGKAYSVLFWSGGKDSFLALRAWVRQQYASGVTKGKALNRLILLTTFSGESRIIAHQDVPIAEVIRQANALDLTLIGIPLYPDLDYVEAIKTGLKLIVDRGAKIDVLIFGDLHLEHIRKWREQELGNLGISLLFPIWHRPYKDLLEDLEASRVPCVVSACERSQTPESDSANPLIVGEVFTRAVFDRMTALGWDAFGENGEFHTLARVWEPQVFCFP